MMIERGRQFVNGLKERYSNRSFKQNLLGLEGVGGYAAASIGLAFLLAQLNPVSEDAHFGYNFNTFCYPLSDGYRRLLFADIESRMPEIKRDLRADINIGGVKIERNFTINNKKAPLYIDVLLPTMGARDEDPTSVAINLFDLNNGKLLDSGSIPYACPIEIDIDQ